MAQKNENRPMDKRKKRPYKQAHAYSQKLDLWWRGHCRSVEEMMDYSIKGTETLKAVAIKEKIIKIYYIKLRVSVHQKTP